MKKTGQVEPPFMVQQSDIQHAIASKGTSINGADNSPVSGYGFESCALNTQRRLPDGLDHKSPDMRSLLGF